MYGNCRMGELDKVPSQAGWSTTCYCYHSQTTATVPRVGMKSGSSAVDFAALFVREG